MAKNITFSVVATPRDRYNLAILLLHKDIKIRGNKSRKEIDRARKSLGLLAPHDAFLKFKESVNTEHIENSRYEKFDVTADNADCVLGWADQLELNPAHSRWLADVLAQLAHGEDDPRAAQAPAYDEPADIAAWAPRPRPLLDNPWNFAEALGELIERSRSFEDFKRRYADEMAPDEPATATEQAASA